MKEKIIRMIHIVSACIPLLLMGLLIAHRILTGGGITAENAHEFLRAGASHVIVTSHVFRDGKVDYERLDKLVQAVGKEHLVLDLSCRKKDGAYYIVTDRWQKFTDECVTEELLDRLEGYARSEERR